MATTGTYTIRLGDQIVERHQPRRVLNSYCLEDFQEMTRRKSLPLGNIDSVMGAYGSEDNGWTGGFVMRFKDGKYGHLFGACPPDGWEYGEINFEEGQHPLEFETPARLVTDLKEINDWVKNPVLE